MVTFVKSYKKNLFASTSTAPDSLFGFPFIFDEEIIEFGIWLLKDLYMGFELSALNFVFFCIN